MLVLEYNVVGVYGNHLAMCALETPSFDEYTTPCGLEWAHRCADPHSAVTTPLVTARGVAC